MKHMIVSHLVARLNALNWPVMDCALASVGLRLLVQWQPKDPAVETRFGFHINILERESEV